jgi:D-lactate dehydrogenase (cytochrome)
MTPLAPELRARFAALVGEAHALSDADAVAPYVTEERGLYRGHSPLVLKPATTAEVAAICALAHDTRTALVPQGGNTGLVGGQTPHHGEVVLSLTRLDRIREVDAASNTMTCEAGVILANAQARANEADRLFPLSLAAEGSCTIGGNLAANAGGTGALAYGVARDLVIGLEVVLADGRIWNGLSKLKKDNTGYDLKNLFVGAEGTLGIITAATLKLFPKPRSVETAFVGLASPQAALDLLQIAQARAGTAVTSFELIGATALGFGLAHGPVKQSPLAGAHPWYVLIELSSPQEEVRATLENILAEGLAHGVVQNATIAASLVQRATLWRLRESLSGAQKPEGGSIKHDVAVPVACVPALIEEASAAVAARIPGARPCPFGHLGDGNIHLNISQPIGADTAAFLARWDEVNAIVHGIVVTLGGSISAEHGIGVMKRDLLPQVKDPVALELMRALKATLDPRGILNPGKVL